MSTTVKIIIGIAIIGSFIAGYFISKKIYDNPEVIRETVTETKRDTVTVKDTIKLTKLLTKSKIDTVWITTYVNPTVEDSLPQLIAKTDTTVNLLGNIFTLATEYHFPPRNYFTHDINIVYQKPIITDSVFVTKYPEETFWSRFHLGIGAGIITDAKEWKVSYGFSAGLYYRIK